MYVSFDFPIYLNLLILIPALIAIHILTIKKRGSRAIRFANIEAIEKIKGVEIFSKNYTTLYLNIILVILLTLAISGARLNIVREASAFSFVIAIDASGSMNAKDVLPDRITAAKESAKAFVDSLETGVHVGVVSFAGATYIESEVSDDKFAVKRSIDGIQVKTVGGTNMYDAVATSVNLLRNEKARAIVILSDGQLNVLSPKEVYEYANDYDTVIHTVGIGTEEGSEASPYFISKLDQDVLAALSFNTGGKSYNITTKEEMKNAFNEIKSVTEREVSINLLNYLLIGVVIVLIINWILQSTRYKVIP